MDVRFIWEEVSDIIFIAKYFRQLLISGCVYDGLFATQEVVVEGPRTFGSDEKRRHIVPPGLNDHGRPHLARRLLFDLLRRFIRIGAITRRFPSFATLRGIRIVPSIFPSFYGSFQVLLPTLPSLQVRRMSLARLLCSSFPADVIVSMGIVEQLCGFILQAGEGRPKRF
jgi:hypothetical protein